MTTWLFRLPHTQNPIRHHITVERGGKAGAPIINVNQRKDVYGPYINTNVEVLPRLDQISHWVLDEFDSRDREGERNNTKIC